MYIQNREQGFINLINEYKLSVGIEIGIRYGLYSKLILEQTNMSLLISLDRFDWENDWEISKRNLSKFGKRSKIICDISPKAASLFENNYFDFIYIDANHTYESVKMDMEAWWPKLKNKGLFCGDDYTMLISPHAGEYGVVQAVDEFESKYNQKIGVTGTDNHNIKNRHRIAKGFGTIIQLILESKIDLNICTSSDEDDIRIPQWYCFKNE